MVINDELKFPPPVKVEPFKAEKKIPAVDGVLPVVRINRFRRQWEKGRGRSSSENREPGSTVIEKEIREMLDQTNHDLEEKGLPIHLALMRDEQGFFLEIYDCTDNLVCNIIKEESINLDEIPSLLQRLQQEAGLIINTVS